LLSQRGRGEEAAGLLVQRARAEFKERKQPQVLASAAMVLEELDRPAEAEQLLREHVVAASEKQPDSALSLGYFLARQQRPGEALDLLDEAAPRCKPERVAQAGVATLRLSPARDTHFRRVEARIEASRKVEPRSAGLLLALADLRDAEGRYDEAIRL